MSAFRTLLAELSDPTAEVDSIRHGHNVYALADMAGTYSPDSDDSAGARFLTWVAGAVAEHVNQYAGTPDDGDDWPLIVGELQNGDAAHEIADGAVPIYTHERWQAFVDLGAYNEDPASELGDDGSDLTQTAGAALYIIAGRLVAALADELSEALDADQAERDDV